jgi:hypothetical protein
LYRLPKQSNILKFCWTFQPGTLALVQVLALRQEKAELLGFPNFAELSMASKVS